MTVTLRSLTCGTALAVGVWVVTTAGAADLPPASAKAAIAADATELQKKLEEIAPAPDKKKGAIRTAKGIAAALTAYGDPATQGQAAKVILALDKKDYAAAADAAKGLASPKADPGAVKAAAGKFDLEDVMNPFKVTKVGGLGMEKDIRDAVKGTAVDPKTVELIGARSAALAEITEKMPNDKAKTNPAMTAKWEKFAKDMATQGKALAAEGAKGAKADAKTVQATFKKLDAACTNCHNDFRNE